MKAHFILFIFKRIRPIVNITSFQPIVLSNMLVVGSTKLSLRITTDTNSTDLIQAANEDVPNRYRHVLSL